MFIPSHVALVVEEYEGVMGSTINDLLSTRSFPDKPTTSTPVSSFSLIGLHESGGHGNRVTGYFLAQETGTHKFFGSCPSGCRLYVSLDDTCNKRQMIMEYKTGALVKK